MAETVSIKTFKTTERFGRQPYDVWYSTKVTRVTSSTGRVYADVMAYRSTKDTKNGYLGEAVGHFQEPWQRYQDAQHAEALAFVA